MDVPALSPPGVFPYLRTVKIELILGCICSLDEVEEEYQQMLYVRDQAFSLLSAKEAVEITFTIVSEAI